MFSNILISQLNNHNFLENALINLDQYITSNRLSFSSEDVICSIANDYVCSLDPELSLEVVRSKIPNNFTRLKQASLFDYFCYQVISSPYDYLDGLFPTAIIHTYHDDESHDEFSLGTVVHRLKDKLNVPHSTAKTLLAKVCGMNSGNEIQRFEDSLTAYLVGWLNLFANLNIDCDIWNVLLKSTYKYLPNFQQYTPSNTHYHNDQMSILIVNKNKAAFKDILSIPSYIFNSSEIQDYFRKTFKNTKIIYTEDDDNGFHRRLYDFAISIPTDSKLKASKARHCVFQSLFFEAINYSTTKKVLSVERDLFNRKRKSEITTSEIEYTFYQFLFSGTKMFIQEHESKLLKQRMKFLNNTHQINTDNDSGLSFLNLFI
ncbi:hypothetical protein [Vibrio aestuarianus]|uniref:hypothetical protein n=1 Tax=Vibrio aestuarianus TaxID=28171 RepID=UPI00237CBFA6|nr:hypothetical protein [Vibrio aestuarianus]MDE1231593.1 hypothetical protein [Vibrio aestuarianus]